ncbi:hypothetical protein Pint_10754 [Pistacia integerrima]|uniref:Uncharacterized protein n=1 Tax=Pistacia integerrima TaxID=434235 RepID=A0ACC0XHB1_9ROSI|nr:hypothetical protein Pint_10754 [Pistacia integerrima]
MSYLRRACMAASVAAVEGQTDYSSKWNSTVRPLSATKQRYTNSSSSSESSDDGNGLYFRDGQNRNQAQDSLHTVMYLNCWAQG